MTMFNK